MRIGSASALVLVAFALAACESGSPTSGSSASNATLDLCGLNCPDPAIDGDTTPPPDPVDPTDPTAPPNTNIGNQTRLATGDTTIALENAVLKSPANGSLSRLTLTSGTTNTAKLEIDTKTKNNKNWPIPKTMNEYVFGTNASGGVGLGGTYKEYHSIDTDEEGGPIVDEELQVWSWDNSYATQYREVAGGGDARRQAWSFGGVRTTAMPVGGQATYNGAYAATSKTWNWINDPSLIKTIDANNTWRVTGTSSLTADFDTHQLDGTLTPTTWNAFRTMGGQTGFADVASANSADPNWMMFMDDDVIIKGTITGNAVSGKASLDPAQGWINGTNPMYAGFFGDGAREVTGAYNFLAVIPAPIGGDLPINDDRRGFVQQSGVFHGCRPGVGTCPP